MNGLAAQLGNRAVAMAISAALLSALFLIASAQMAGAAGVVGTGTAASCTDAALDIALAGGGLVTYNCGPAAVTIDVSTGTGTKTIAADTTIDGGSLITISGGNSVRVFSVQFGVSVTVQNLTIANGFMQSAFSSGIENYGTLTVTNTTFSDNSVTYAVSGGNGGAIANFGMLTVANSTFFRNSAPDGGGAIRNASGTLTITDSTFLNNSTDGSVDSGGAIANTGMLTVTNSIFSNNRALGSGGGGIVSFDGFTTVTDSTFSDNSGDSGAITSVGGPLTVANSIFSHNSASLEGGGIYTFSSEPPRRSPLAPSKVIARATAAAVSTVVSAAH